jgi:hypothetical protein
MAKSFTCSCCRCKMSANPRIKNQRYCGKEGCQRERKRKWQLNKMASDSDYRANQQDAYRAWRERNPDYWRRRRISALISPPSKSASPAASTGKMDTIEPFYHFIPGTYLMKPLCGTARKMDAIMVKIVQFSDG